MGRDIFDAEVYGGVPPSSGLADHRDVSSDIQGGGMVVVIGGGCLRGGGYIANEVVHLEVEGYHCNIYCEYAHL